MRRRRRLSLRLVPFRSSEKVRGSGRRRRPRPRPMRQPRELHPSDAGWSRYSRCRSICYCLCGAKKKYRSLSLANQVLPFTMTSCPHRQLPMIASFPTPRRDKTPTSRRPVLPLTAPMLLLAMPRVILISLLICWSPLAPTLPPTLMIDLTSWPMWLSDLCIGILTRYRRLPFSVLSALPRMPVLALPVALVEIRRSTCFLVAKNPFC
mmetsp:Transcript_5725/g.12411  ORF Transcript_5725/g.12411 Transcript_5725/m.12411 type:complete len:208 (-) Transcript_5725:286-909(-)